jgi:indolepyruvate ferredoxin oxidoreductase, beta subunit
VRASNIVMLGAATPFIDIPIESIENGIRGIFSRKGEEVVRLNMNALHAGREFALANK